MGRRVRRAIRRVTRTVERVGREIGRGAESGLRMVTNPLEEGLRGARDLILDPLLNPMDAYMKQQEEYNKKLEQDQEKADKEKAEAEAEAKRQEEEARKEAMAGFGNADTALGSLGMSEDQTLGRSSALGTMKGRRRK